MAKTATPNPNHGTTTDTNGKEVSYLNKEAFGLPLNEQGQIIGVPTIEDGHKKDYAPLRRGDFATLSDWLYWEADLIEFKMEEYVERKTREANANRRKAELEALPDGSIEKEAAKAKDKVSRMVDNLLDSGMTADDIKATIGLDIATLGY